MITNYTLIKWLHKKASTRTRMPTVTALSSKEGGWRAFQERPGCKVGPMDLQPALRQLTLWPWVTGYASLCVDFSSVKLGGWIQLSVWLLPGWQSVIYGLWAELQKLTQISIKKWEITNRGRSRGRNIQEIENNKKRWHLLDVTSYWMNHHLLDVTTLGYVFSVCFMLFNSLNPHTIGEKLSSLCTRGKIEEQEIK